MRLVDFLPGPGPILISVGGNKAVPQGLWNMALKFTVGLCGPDFRLGMAEGVPILSPW